MRMNEMLNQPGDVRKEEEKKPLTETHTTASCPSYK